MAVAATAVAVTSCLQQHTVTGSVTITQLQSQSFDASTISIFGTYGKPWRGSSQVRAPPKIRDAVVDANTSHTCYLFGRTGTGVVAEDAQNTAVPILAYSSLMMHHFTRMGLGDTSQVQLPVVMSEGLCCATRSKHYPEACPTCLSHPPGSTFALQV
eukprot:361574-Chlamydomonas_euryale.AAC.4